MGDDHTMGDGTAEIELGHAYEALEHATFMSDARLIEAARRRVRTALLTVADARAVNVPQTGRRHVLVMGQDTSGLELGLMFAENDWTTTGYDDRSSLIKTLRAGESIVEGVDSVRVQRALDAGTYIATADLTDLGPFEVAVITTPVLLRGGSFDLTELTAVSAIVGRNLHPGATIVVTSAAYPGTTEDVVVPILEAASDLEAGVDFLVGYSQDRSDPGNPHWNLHTTPRIVAGINDASLTALKEFFAEFCEYVVPASSPREAELAGMLEKLFRIVNIALVNEIAMYARETDVDIGDAINLASTKPFGFMPFVPGLGTGVGPALPSEGLPADSGASIVTRFTQLANDINVQMPRYVVRRLQDSLSSRFGKPLRGSQILVLGLADRRDTGRVEGSPAVRFAHLLRKHHAVVRAVEPHLHEETYETIELVGLDEAALRWADAVVIATPHTEFDYDLVVRTAAYVFDTRGITRGPNVERL